MYGLCNKSILKGTPENRSVIQYKKQRWVFCQSRMKPRFATKGLGSLNKFMFMYKIYVYVQDGLKNIHFIG